MVLAVALLIGGLFLYDEIASDFRYENIVFSELDHDPSRSVPALSSSELDKIYQILNQNFTYIGKGHQAFVFASDDEEYVLKFFRFRRLKPSVLTDYLVAIPFIGSYFAHLEQKRLHRIEKLFTGYQVAYDYDRENTGMVYTHLNSTLFLNRRINVKDRFGFTHIINLDDVFFAIQQRAYSTKEVLVRLLNQGDVETAKLRIRQLFDLYIDEYQHGVFDQDHNIIHNTGFTQDRPIRLDIGQLKRDEDIKNPEVYQKDLQKLVNRRLAPWLRKYYPDFSEEIILDMQGKISPGEST